MSYLGPEPARALIDQSAIAPDVQVPFLSSRKNKIINGAFDIWQRGVSFSVNGEYASDRWQVQGNNSSHVTTRQDFAEGQTDVPGNPEFYSRTVVTSVPGAGNFITLVQKLEGVQTLAGEIITYSFWAKADSAKDIAVEFSRDYGTGGSPSSFEISIGGVTTISLTTAWKKFTVTLTFPSISGKTIGTNNTDFINCSFWLDAGSSFDGRTNTLGQQSGTFDIANTQIEKGNIATDFEQLHIGDVLAQCQRYYQRYDNNTNARFLGVGHATAGVTAVMPLLFSVTMRNNPTFSISANNALKASSTTGSQIESTAIGTTTLTETGVQIITTVASGLIAGEASQILLSPSEWIAFDAEL